MSSLLFWKYKLNAQDVIRAVIRAAQSHTDSKHSTSTVRFRFMWWMNQMKREWSTNQRYEQQSERVSDITWTYMTGKEQKSPFFNFLIILLSGAILTFVHQVKLVTSVMAAFYFQATLINCGHVLQRLHLHLWLDCKTKLISGWFTALPLI